MNPTELLLQAVSDDTKVISTSEQVTNNYVETATSITSFTCMIVSYGESQV